MSSTGVEGGEHLTEAEQEQLNKLLSDPIFFPEAFKNWISELTRSEVTPNLPFANILNSDQLKGGVFFFPNISPSYPLFGPWRNAGTISIPGPCEALVFFMGSSVNWAGDYGHLGLSVNGSTPDLNQILVYRGELLRRIFGGRAQYVQLPNTDNTVVLQVRKEGSGDVDFQDLAAAVFRIFLDTS